MDDKGVFGDCFSLLFNLIISQLFIGAISSLIELIRIFTINILSHYILKEEYIQKYGVYIQPVITCVLLIGMGMVVYYLSKWTSSSDSCDNTVFVKYLLYFILGGLLIGFILFILFYYYRLKTKVNNLKSKKIGYKVKENSYN